jgi:GH25 family lysozyme M1 (1,4-beta-N-acetylmuramidase)
MKIYNKGIDVSHWQGNIQWDKVAKDGIDFVMLKATESNNYIDPTFYDHANNAKKAGLLVGAYHFARFSSVEKAIKEADYFIKVIKASSIDFEMPLVLDLESNDSHLSKKDLSECMNVFIERVQKETGKEVMLYTFKAFLENNLNKPLAVPFWYARYGVEQPDIPCDIWQHTDKGKVNGIAGIVDMNCTFRDFITVKSATKSTGGGKKVTGLGQATVKADALSLRDAPGVNGKLIRTLKKGETYNVYAIKDGWYNLGANQWVSNTGDKYMDYTPNAPDKTYRVTTGTFANKQQAEAAAVKIKNEFGYVTYVGEA